jgi:hypothetical protein
VRIGRVLGDRVVERFATDAESSSEVQIWITDAVAL